MGNVTGRIAVGHYIIIRIIRIIIVRRVKRIRGNSPSGGGEQNTRARVASANNKVEFFIIFFLPSSDPSFVSCLYCTVAASWHFFFFFYRPYRYNFLTR